MISSNTLLIRHMPSELSVEEKEDFFKHFGAVYVKVIGKSNQKSNFIFARFDTHEAAQIALHRLHQAEILGSHLSVEFARSEKCDEFTTTEQSKSISHINKESKSQKYHESFIYRLSSWTSEVDFNIPPPVHLKYQYPPPSRMVLENIGKTLASVPKFYTQVLHLMNKMNLPCPFSESFPIETDIFENTTKEQNMETVCEERGTLSASEEESEIESSGDESKKMGEIIPAKRTLPEKKIKLKRPKLIKPIAVIPSAKTVTKTRDVFDIVDKELQAKKIQVKITPDLSSIHIAEETQKSIPTGEGFEKLHVTEEASKNEANIEACPTEENVDVAVGTCITEHELAANRVSSRDQWILPVFKNYQTGAPSCRLYIKNLSKQVETRDLHYIYKRYHLPDQEEQGTMFDIRLMQEGRMKGQAFINLQSVEQAQKALKETNGFLLKGKPMVVQFARSSKADTSKTK